MKYIYSMISTLLILLFIGLSLSGCYPTHSPETQTANTGTENLQSLLERKDTIEFSYTWVDSVSRSPKTLADHLLLTSMPANTTLDGEMKEMLYDLSFTDTIQHHILLDTNRQHDFTQSPYYLNYNRKLQTATFSTADNNYPATYIYRLYPCEEPAKNLLVCIEVQAGMASDEYTLRAEYYNSANQEWIKARSVFPRINGKDILSDVPAGMHESTAAGFQFWFEDNKLGVVPQQQTGAVESNITEEVDYEPVMLAWDSCRFKVD
jgi:hypothetical protein